MTQAMGPKTHGLAFACVVLLAGCAASAESAPVPALTQVPSSHRNMGFVLDEGDSCDLTAQQPGEWKGTVLEGGVVRYDLVGGPGRLVITAASAPRRVVLDLKDLQPGTTVMFVERSVQVIEP